MRIAASFNTSVIHMISRLNKGNIVVGTAFLLAIPSMMIPNVLATSTCSNSSSNWADQSLCGHGAMLAIIVTSHDVNLESKLAAYNAQHNLPACTVENGCLEIATPYGISRSNPASNADMSSFVIQAHQSLPGAKILVVEAKSISWQDKYDAANYAKTLPEVAKVFSVSYSKVVMIIGLTLK